jgi:hypothetical protein
MRSLLALLLVAGSAHAAPAFGVVLSNDSTKIRIEIADLPGAKDLFIVTWDDLPGGTATGAMVFYRDQGSTETRYFAVGGTGPFAIADRGQHTLINGTLVPIYSVVQRDPDHPIRLVAGSGKSLDATAMLARYAAFEHVGAPGEARPAIETAITGAAAHANRTCSARLAPQVQWDGFTKAGKLGLAKQAMAIFEALESLCDDKDYRAAVQALTAVRVELRADATGLELKTGGAVLTAAFSDTSYNPRESARRWLENHL